MNFRSEENSLRKSVKRFFSFGLAIAKFVTREGNTNENSIFKNLKFNPKYPDIKRLTDEQIWAKTLKKIKMIRL